jgi:hypothetical protein
MRPGLLAVLSCALAGACAEVPGAADAPGDGAVPRDWRFEPVAGATCANGSAYGVGVSMGSPSDVVLLIEGGGACWDDTSCNELRTALLTHADLDPELVLAAGRAREGFLFSRDPALGPFASATFVDVPYCTGDLHVGDAVRDYPGGTIRHVGARNLMGALELARRLVPGASRVFLVGSSAGGFGASMAWDRARAVFVGAEVHVLNDSGPLFAVPDDRWALMRDAWSAVLPEGCGACATSLAAVVEHNLATVPPTERFGLLSHSEDALTRGTFGLPAGVLSMTLDDWASRFAASPGHRSFVVEGERHIVLISPDAAVGGVTPRAWAFAFATGEGWVNVGP